VNASIESSNLDFLRAAAVLFVVGSHLLYFFARCGSSDARHLEALHSIGNWGVLIFFVHTCMVLMFSLERQHIRYKGRPNYFPFLIRRIFRIFPLSVLVVLSVLLLRLPVAYITLHGQFEPAHMGWVGVVSNLLLVQDITHRVSVIVPLWSLPYEMQMYLFLPALFLLVRSPRGARFVLALWIVSAFAGMHGGRLERLGVPDFIDYIPCFLPGVLAYALTRGWRLQLPAYLWPPALAVLTAIYLHRPDVSHAYFSCLLLGVLIPQFRELANPTVRLISNTIARYSYGVYLTHFACIWLAFQALPANWEWLRWVMFVATATVLPCALYHLVEKPFIQAGERVACVLRDRMPTMQVQA